jgi:hypothetical protein
MLVITDDFRVLDGDGSLSGVGVLAAVCFHGDSSEEVMYRMCESEDRAGLERFLKHAVSTYRECRLPQEK